MKSLTIFNAAATSSVLVPVILAQPAYAIGGGEGFHETHTDLSFTNVALLVLGLALLVALYRGLSRGAGLFNARTLLLLAAFASVILVGVATHIFGHAHQIGGLVVEALPTRDLFGQPSRPRVRIVTSSVPLEPFLFALTLFLPGTDLVSTTQWTTVPVSDDWGVYSGDGLKLFMTIYRLSGWALTGFMAIMLGASASSGTRND